MKGTQGLLIAAGLGIAGAICNWFYISQQARHYQAVSFVALRSDAQLNLGDIFKQEHFTRVDVPAARVGNLREVAVQWKDLPTVVGESAKRSYHGGEILLRQDLKSAARRDLSSLLGENEAVRWVPVDPRSFVPDYVNPGDRVSFIVSGPGVSGSGRGTGSGRFPAAGSETVGPFEILALGSRLGRREYLKAEGGSLGQQSLIAIRVKLSGGRLEEKATRLFDLLRRAGNRGAQVMLLSSKKKVTSGP